MALGSPPSAPEEHPNAEIETLPAGTRLRRIYTPKPYGTEALTFRSFGPVSRFDHHRRPNGFPAAGHDPDRGIMYATEGLRCCLAEAFGDEGVVEVDGYYVALLEVAAPLALLDVRDIAARRAGTIPAVYGDGNRETTQDWGRYWYEHPDFQHCDGLLYRSAQTGEDDVVALWERAEGKVTCVGDWLLDDPGIIDDVVVAADKAELAMPPT
jgi:RES domain